MEATILEALDRLAGVLAGGAATVLTACLLGRTALGLLRPLRGKLTREEGWVFSFACGSALLSTLVFLLCSLRWFHDLSVVLASVGALACWLRWGRWTWPSLTREPRRIPRWWQLTLFVPAAVYGVLYAVHTLAPETRTDAMGYHLGLVQRYYRAHGFVPLTTNIYAQISQGAEMLYLFAYSIGRESAAKIVHLSFLVATVGAILCLARRFRADLAGIFAAVVFFTCPVVIPDATSTYNDCALAFSLFCTFYALLLWWQHRDSEWLALLGVLIGFSFAVKYTGVVAVVAAAVAAGAILLRTGNWSRALSGLALSGLAAAAVGLPWLVKSAVITGNPFAPFFNDWFPNPYFSVEWESAYTFAMRSYRDGPFDRWNQLLAAPFDLVLGERYAGSLGWMVLLAPIAPLAWRAPLARWLLPAALASALPWLWNAGARFLIPSLPFALLAIGTALELVPRRARIALAAILLAGQCITSWPAQRGRWYYPGLWSVEGFPWRAALGLEPDKWHLARNVEFFLLADRLDKVAGPDTRILSFGNLPEAYFKAELLVAYQGLENQDLADALLASLDAMQRPESVVRASWPTRELRGVRVEQTRSHRARAWIVSEIRFLRDGVRLPAGNDITAWSDPLPWHASRLFDGDIFTAWNSREPPRPGMMLEARFARAVLANGMELIHPTASATAQERLVFSALTDDGEWTELLPGALELVRLTVDPQAIRTAANSLLRRHGIDYVVFNLDARDPYFSQTRTIASEPAAWGLKRVFVDRTAVLFKVTEQTD